MDRTDPTRITRSGMQEFFAHYADLMRQGDDDDDLGRAAVNQYGPYADEPSRDRRALQIRLTELDYEYAKYLGAGWVVHGIRRALAEARHRCCNCRCCRRVLLKNQRRDYEAEKRAQRIANGLASGLYFK